jgi:hypothetical protein
MLLILRRTLNHNQLQFWHLISSHLPMWSMLHWRQQELAYQRLFEHYLGL